MTRLGRLAAGVPNALTLARVFAIPPLVVLVLESGDGSSAAAAGVFALAALSDVLDGHLARSRGYVTTFGKVADPIADKLLIGAALASLVAMDRVGAWVVAVIMGRELAVSGLRLVAGRDGVVISASRFGKLKMALQVGMILALIAAPDASAGWVEGLVVATVAVTIASGLDYFVAFRRRVTADVPARRVAKAGSASRRPDRAR